jgi:LmbE family N-acetylglucosaminyl deacetylase
MRKGSAFSAGVACGLVVAVAFGFVRSTDTGSEENTSFAGVPVREDDGKLGIIVFGAHPDDCEIRAGGTATMWAQRGDHVKFVSLTNGDIGHWGMAGGPLAKRRFAEVKAAADILGVTTEVLDIHDGELMPTLENRKIMTRLIRQWNADIVIGHRPNDYHPDHRYTGVLMQDCAYMAAVPFLCPDMPPLKKNPVFLYSYDRFQLPTPFRPDVVVALDSVMDKKLDALAQIESQFIEGGAMGNAGRVPENEEQKRAAVERLRNGFRRRAAQIAERCRDKLVELYGPEQARQVQYAEAFEICEYGRRPSNEELKKLFPLTP